MRVKVRQRGGIDRRVRSLSAVLALGLVLALVLVTPAIAATRGPTKLSDPQVSPRTATPTTTVQFSVTYRNREGSPPDAVSVVIDGRAHAMTAAAGDDSWKDGVRFAFATALPAGSHPVRFTGIDRERFTDEVDGGLVTVVLPKPTPTPKPTPKPTPRPTATPAPTAKPAATATPWPTPIPGSTASAAPTAVPAESAGTGAGGQGGPIRSSVPSVAPSSSALPSPSVGGVAVLPGGPGGGGSRWTDDGGFGIDWDLANTLDALGVGSGDQPLARLVPVVVSTTGAVAMAMAFMFFGKKRRDGAPPAPDDVLSAAAATGTPLPPAGELLPDGSGPARPGGAPGQLDEEALMPRWRRPSLLQARKADPLRGTAGPAPRLTFDHGLVGPLDGRERRYIRYTAVRLLDSPDELRGTAIGFLDQGDEVQVLEATGAYRYVLSPDGRQGWIHRMTLGQVVDEDAGRGPAPGDGPPDTDVDDDVLSAFFAARART
jgi:hypothetical protein